MNVCIEKSSGHAYCGNSRGLMFKSINEAISHNGELKPCPACAKAISVALGGVDLNKSLDNAVDAILWLEKPLRRIVKGLNNGINTVPNSIPHSDAKIALQRYDNFMEKYARG